MPVLGCEVGQNTCEVGFAVRNCSTDLRPDKKRPLSLVLVRLIHQPILIRLPKAPGQRHDVFHFHQFVQVRPQPRVAPLERLAQLAPRKTDLLGFPLAGLPLRRNRQISSNNSRPGRDRSSRLWPNKLVRQFVGNGDVIQRRFNVVAKLGVVLARAVATGAGTSRLK